MVAEKKRKAVGRAEAGVASDRKVRVAAAVRAAVSVASSPAMLYTPGQMSDEESVLRECLSVYRRDRAEKALRWGRRREWLFFGGSVAIGSALFSRGSFQTRPLARVFI